MKDYLLIYLIVSMFITLVIFVLLVISILKKEQPIIKEIIHKQEAIQPKKEIIIEINSPLKSNQASRLQSVSLHLENSPKDFKG